MNSILSSLIIFSGVFFFLEYYCVRKYGTDKKKDPRNKTLRKKKISIFFLTTAFFATAILNVIAWQLYEQNSDLLLFWITTIQIVLTFIVYKIAMKERIRIDNLKKDRLLL